VHDAGEGGERKETTKRKINVKFIVHITTGGRHRLRLLRLLQTDSQRTVSPPSGIS